MTPGGGIKRGGQGGRAGKPGSHRKGASVGSGGVRRKGLEPRKPTPKAEERTGHPAARKASAVRRGDAKGRPDPGARSRGNTAARKPPAQSTGRGPATGRGRSAPRGKRSDEDIVVGRNPVTEALRAAMPARSLVVAQGIDHDERVTEALKRALALKIPVREASRQELDRMSDGAVHQGLLLLASPYEYAHPDDVLRLAVGAAEPALVVALDSVTDPHNLGAVVRSAAAFGAHGVLIPERRSASMSPAAWKASAGAAARLPVARATNLVRTLKGYADAGLTVVGLDGRAALGVDDLEVATDPLCLVVGAEGSGLSRLVAERVDVLVRIPMAAETESLNASVATGIVLAEIARRRRLAGHAP